MYICANISVQATGLITCLKVQNQNMEVSILVFKTINLSTKSAKIVFLNAKSSLSDSKSMKSNFKSGNIKDKSALLKFDIGTLETRY